MYIFVVVPESQASMDLPSQEQAQVGRHVLAQETLALPNQRTSHRALRVHHVNIGDRCRVSRTKGEHCRFHIDWYY